MAELLCVSGITIASRYWGEHCLLQTKRQPVIIGLFCRDKKFILVFDCLISGIFFCDKTLEMQCSRNSWWFGSVSVELFNNCLGGRGTGGLVTKTNLGLLQMD